jgi:hypothetical protein
LLELLDLHGRPGRDHGAMNGTCVWKRHSVRCANAATVSYRTVGMTLALCDTHWDAIRASLVLVFGDWELVAEVEEVA